jgi:hypothetical protein
MCEYSDAIELPKPLVGRGYRLSHFWLAKEVNIELKRSCSNSAYKTIKYYENTKYILKKGKTKSAQLSCV